MMAAITIPDEVDPGTVYHPRGASAELFDCHDREVLLAGPAGTGKTRSLLEKAYLCAMKYDGMRCLFVRKTRASCTTSVLVTFESKVVPPGKAILYGPARRNRQSYRFENGSEIVVGGMDKAEKTLSTEYDLICLTGDAIIQSPSIIKHASKRAYSGPLVTIRTAAGNVLTGTPNHPILTDHGWVGLGSLTLGNNVISSRFSQSERPCSDPNIENHPAPIADIARALSLTESSRTERIETVPMNFHGDGGYGDVDIVTADSNFHSCIQSTVYQPCVEFDCRWRDFQSQPFMRLRSLDLLIFGMSATPILFPSKRSDSSGMFCRLATQAASLSNFCSTFLKPLNPFCISRMIDPDFPGFTRVINLGTTTAEFGSNHRVTDPELCGNRNKPAVAVQVRGDGIIERGLRDQEATVSHHGGISGRSNRYTSGFKLLTKTGDSDLEIGANGLGGLASDVVADRIVHIETVNNAKCGHVYNLQTEAGWYFANGIITHNCAFEATELTEHDWEMLQRAKRNNVMPYQQAIADCNPAGSRHWLNMRANTDQMTRLISHHEDNPLLYNDDGTITPAGDEYVNHVLEKLSGARYQRLRLGKWAEAQGVVYADFDPAIHLIEPFPIPKEWRRIRSIDFGYTNPFVCQWWAMDNDNRMFMYREMYMGSRIVEDHAKQINSLSGDEYFEASVADHDAEDRATLERHGISTSAAVKTIRGGIDAVTARLKKQRDGRPSLFVFRDSLAELDADLEDRKRPVCTPHEFEAYVWPTVKEGAANARNPREVPLDRDDHGMDAMRYAVAYVDGISATDVLPVSVPSAVIGDGVIDMGGFPEIPNLGVSDLDNEELWTDG